MNKKLQIINSLKKKEKKQLRYDLIFPHSKIQQNCSKIFLSGDLPKDPNS